MDAFKDLHLKKNILKFTTKIHHQFVNGTAFVSIFCYSLIVSSI